MTKKVISILIAALLLFSTFPLTAFAAEADAAQTGVTVIDEVAVFDVVAPASGQHPSYDAEVFFGAPYERYDINNSYYQNGVAWYEAGTSDLLTPSSTFELGKSYFVRVYLVPVSDEYQFSGAPSGQLNYKDATVETVAGKKYLFVTYTFTCYDYIDSISAVVDGPEAGSKPSYTVEVEADGYKLYDFTDGTVKNGVSWFNLTDNEPMKPGTDTFEGGKEYTVSVYLIVINTDQFRFADGLTRSLTYYTSVSETPATASATYETVNDFSVVLKSTIRCYNYLDSAAVTITEPSPDYSPSYTVGIDEDAHYHVDIGNNPPAYLGVTWYDVETGSVLDPDTSKFVAGKQYKVDILLHPDDSYRFLGSDKMTATVNGNDAEAVNRPEFSRSLVYTFTCPEKLNKAEVTITEPVAGQKPSYVAAAPEDQGYEIYPLNGYGFVNGVIWYDENDNYLDPDTAVFEAGKQYKVEIEVGPIYPYKFNNAADMTGTVNGKDAEVYNRPEYSRGLAYTFICPAPGPQPTPYRLSGEVTSFINNTDTVTVELISENFYALTTTDENSPSSGYLFENVPEGEYTLRVSKKDHVTRDYAVTVSGDTVLDVKIHPLGDIDGDGATTTFDFALANAHAKGVNTITDPYQLACANVDGEGDVTTFDAALINSHAKGVSLLY